MKQYEKILYSRVGPRLHYVHNNTCCTNTPQRNALHTLPAFFNLEVLRELLQVFLYSLSDCKLKSNDWVKL
jgi:hypothetical protein